MTLRQQIKERVIRDARRNPPADLPSFKRGAISTFDCITNPLLIAELDRIEDLPGMSLTRLISEAWNEFQREQVMDRSIRAWTQRSKL